MPPEISTALRVLTFRARAGELRSLNHRHLLLGLVLTMAGGHGALVVGPQGESVVTPGHWCGGLVFALSFFLWLFLWPLLWPLQPPQWSWRDVLIFISLNIAT